MRPPRPSASAHRHWRLSWSGDGAIATSAREVGFGSPSSLRRAFAREFGVTPAAFGSVAPARVAEWIVRRCRCGHRALGGFAVVVGPRVRPPVRCGPSGLPIATIAREVRFARTLLRRAFACRFGRPPSLSRGGSPVLAAELIVCRSQRGLV
ncbi:AraC family transcriptional regulator [Amycolatopsis sp. CA-161197]|uniref:AraC family transcriptional regulator n=1 Tax=Amycolatopsis sp. CA-161197 TaxID=3239922 RepID=UPI003D8BA27B